MWQTAHTRRVAGRPVERRQAAASCSTKRHSRHPAHEGATQTRRTIVQAQPEAAGGSQAQPTNRRQASTSRTRLTTVRLLTRLPSCKSSCTAHHARRLTHKKPQARNSTHLNTPAGPKQHLYTQDLARERVQYAPDPPKCVGSMQQQPQHQWQHTQLGAKRGTRAKCVQHGLPWAHPAVAHTHMGRASRAKPA